MQVVSSHGYILGVGGRAVKAADSKSSGHLPAQVQILSDAILFATSSVSVVLLKGVLPLCLA